MNETPCNREELLVTSGCCDQCLFGPRAIVDARRRAEVLEGCAARQTWFECHKGTLRGQHAMCAGYAALAERGGNPKVALLLRLGRSLGVVHTINPETGARTPCESR